MNPLATCCPWARASTWCRLCRSAVHAVGYRGRERVHRPSPESRRPVRPQERRTTIGIYGTLLVNNYSRRRSNEASSRICQLALAPHLAGRRAYYAVVDQAYVDGFEFRKDAWTLCGADEVNWRTGMMTLSDKPLENAGSIDDAVSAGLGFLPADTIEALLL